MNRVSRNEFLSLIKRTFEGHGYCCGDYEDAATSTYWLEEQGLNGLNLARLAIERSPNGRDPVTIIEDAPTYVVLDAGGCSAIVCGQQILEFSLSKLMQENSCCIEVKNCHEHVAILAALATTALPARVAVRWKTNDQLFCLSASPDKTVPEASLESFNDKDSDDQLIQIGNTSNPVCENIQNAADDLPKLSQRQGTVEVDSQHWKHFEHLAEAVLVETSDRSRRGAGAE